MEENIENTEKKQRDTKKISKAASLLAKTAIATTVAAGTLFFGTCVEYIKPDQWGILQVQVGENKGIQKKNYEKGYHVVWPFIETMHKLPKEVNVLTLHKDFQNKESDFDSMQFGKSAHIETSDGFYVDIDASIMYKITNPYKTITELGGGNLYVTNGMIPKSEPALKATLGQLEPEDFYNAKKRKEKQEVARKNLDTIMGQYGIDVEQVLVRYVSYHPEIQGKIEDTVLKKQLVHTNKSIAEQNNAQARLDKIIEEGIAAGDAKLNEGRAYKVSKESEGDKYNRTSIARGDKLVRLANAYATEVVNKAYEGPGSELLVGREMAKVIKNMDYILAPTGKGGFNPLDISGTLQSFGVIGGERK